MSALDKYSDADQVEIKRSIIILEDFLAGKGSYEDHDIQEAIDLLKEKHPEDALSSEVIDLLNSDPTIVTVARARAKYVLTYFNNPETPEGTAEYVKKLTDLTSVPEGADTTAETGVMTDMINKGGLTHKEQQKLLQEVQNPLKKATPEMNQWLNRFKTLQKLTDARGPLNKEKGEAEREKDTKNQELDQLKTDQAANETKLKEIQGKIRDFREDANNLTAQADAEADPAEATRLRTDSSNALGEATRLAPDLGLLEGRRDDLAAEIKTANDAFNAIQGEYNKHTTNLANLDQAIEFKGTGAYSYKGLYPILLHVKEFLAEKEGKKVSPDVLLKEVEQAIGVERADEYEKLPSQIFFKDLKKTLGRLNDPYLKGLDMKRLAHYAQDNDQANIEDFIDAIKEPADKKMKMKNVVARLSKIAEIAAIQCKAQGKDEPEIIDPFNNLMKHLDGLRDDYINSEGVAELKAQEEHKDKSDAHLRGLLMEQLRIRPENLQMFAEPDGKIAEFRQARKANKNNRRAKLKSKADWGMEKLEWWNALSGEQQKQLGKAGEVGINVGGKVLRFTGWVALAVALAGTTALTLGGGGLAVLGIKYIPRDKLLAAAKLGGFAALGPLGAASKWVRDGIKNNAAKLVGKEIKPEKNKEENRPSVSDKVKEALSKGPDKQAKSKPYVPPKAANEAPPARSKAV